MGYRFVLLFLLFIVTACAGVQRTSDPWNGQVRVDGNLRAMMHEGKTGPVVRLSRLLPDDALYGLGALADMTGEVTIVAGKAYLSYGKDQQAAAQTPEDLDAAAALLVS